MELKPFLLLMGVITIIPFNRTNMELKQVIVKFKTKLARLLIAPIWN